MLKRIKLPGWIVIGVLVLLVFVGVHKIFAKGEVESIELGARNSSANIYPGLDKTTTTKETELYTLSISHPYTENKKINKQIDKWINQQKKEFVTNTKESKAMLESNKFRAHLNIQVETKQLADKIYALELESYQITGGANGSTKLKPFVVDLNKDKILAMGDIFQLSNKTIEEVKELVINNIHADKKVSPYVFDEYLQAALQDLEKWNLSVSPDKVTFYFDQYEVAAGAAGAIKSEISMNTIKPYLNKELVKRIEAKKDEEKKENKKKVVEKKEKNEQKLDSDGKYVALTFDDGPHPEVTPRILETLKKHNARATFFMLGSQA